MTYFSRHFLVFTINSLYNSKTHFSGDSLH